MTSKQYEEALTWKDRLERAIKSKGFDSEDRDLVETWTCCAVGEHLGLAESDYDGTTIAVEEVIRTKAPELRSLGFQFACAVETDNVEYAVQAYNEISEMDVPEMEFLVIEAD